MYTNFWNLLYLQMKDKNRYASFRIRIAVGLYISDSWFYSSCFNYMVLLSRQIFLARAPMIRVTMLSWPSQQGCCWCTGAYLSPGHLQLSWWHRPVGAFQECPDVMHHIVAGYLFYFVFFDFLLFPIYLYRLKHPATGCSSMLPCVHT